MRFRTSPSLIARLRNSQDADAWREFQASYRPFIRRVGIDAGLARHRLADLSQDVFLTLVRVIPRFTYDPSRGRFRSWLARVVRSRCSDLVRRDRRDALVRSRVSPRPAASPVSLAGETNAGRDTLRKVLISLRASTRPLTWDCFERHVLEQRPALEVADALGTTVNAVYLSSMRVMQRLERECRERLEQEEGHECKTMSIVN